jgi:2-haloacid dehalogenase
MNASSFGGFAGIVFDAYGTLFDVTAIEQVCTPHVSDAAAFAQMWRGKQLEYAVLRTSMDRYADFGQITSDALDYTATLFRVELTPVERARLMQAWLTLPAFAEVPLALDKLQAHGHRMLILSNGTRQMLEPLLDHNGVRSAFIDILTSERVQCFKPDPTIYALVSSRIYARMNEILFVTANGFDVAGAKAAGFTVCRVDRYGLPLDLLDFTPDIVVRDLLELVGLLGDEPS